MVLKPDKRKGIVAVNKKDSLDQLFNDPTKFEILKEDPTLRNLSTIQKYLNALKLRGEIKKYENRQMRPIFSQIGRAHGLSKIHKQFLKVPSFRPVVDTTKTPHYGVRKFLTNLLNPLTQNEYTVKGSFEAVNMIREIRPELDQDYRNLPSDVTSFFTNVPLKNGANL